MFAVQLAERDLVLAEVVRTRQPPHLVVPVAGEVVRLVGALLRREGELRDAGAGWVFESIDALRDGLGETPLG